jgi:hypothetical protein
MYTRYKYRHKMDTPAFGQVHIERYIREQMRNQERDTLYKTIGSISKLGGQVIGA